MLTQLPFYSLTGRFITTPSLYSHHSVARMWCGVSKGFIRLANLRAACFGKSILRRYYGVSRYSKFLTKNSVVVRSAIIFILDCLSHERITISLKQNKAAALAICPTRYVLSSNDCALSTIELGITSVVVNIRRVEMKRSLIGCGFVSSNFTLCFYCFWSTLASPELEDSEEDEEDLAFFFIDLLLSLKMALVLACIKFNLTERLPNYYYQDNYQPSTKRMVSISTFATHLSNL